MRCLLLVFVLLLGCGSSPPAAAPPVANVAVSVDATPAVEPDAGLESAPRLIGGGCCDDNGHWTCGRVPRQGECPGYSGVVEP